jgi:hypothetical protein
MVKQVAACLAPSCGIRVIDTVFVGGILFCVWSSASVMFIVIWMDGYRSVSHSIKHSIYRIQKERDNSVDTTGG